MALTGSIYTTTGPVCQTVNGNIYDSKDAVYLNGGPNGGGSGLPDGNYFVRVTDPSGTNVLGFSNTANVQVSGGSFVQCYHLSDIVFTGTSGFTVPGYDSTTNIGGEYKVWVGTDSTFADTKTDNFKIKSGTNGCGDVCTPEQTTISGIKCRDNTAGFGTPFDGVCEVGESLLQGWHISVTYTSGGTLNTNADIVTDAGGKWTVSADENTTLTACEVLQTDWAQTGPLANATSGPFSVTTIGGIRCWTGTVGNTTVTNLNFANAGQTTVSGHKCYDFTTPAASTSLNGACDDGETKLSGFVIHVAYLNLGVSSTADVTTDNTGAWSITADEGSALTACEVLQNSQQDWLQTGPKTTFTSSAFTVNVNKCWTTTGVPADPVTNLDFANVAQVSGTKYYDTNPNGVPDSGEPTISGFKITMCSDASCPGTITQTVFTDGSGNFVFTLPTPTSTYRIGEVVPNASWSQTGPLNGASPVSNVGSGSATANTVKQWGGSGPVNGLYFTNVCFVTNAKALTLGFWSNRTGQALETDADFVSLTNLNLRNGDGSTRDFTDTLAKNKTALSTWLLNATATNMAYMLSAQLATMQLNVNHGLDPNLLIYAPGTNSANAAGYATIAAVMAEANTLLGTKGIILSGDTDRARAEALKTALDNANNGKNIVGSGPGACPFTTPY
jgi:hypothetical protein